MDRLNARPGKAPGSEDSPREQRPRLAIGTEWTEVEVTSEPYVIVTFRGYAPVVKVREAGKGDELPLFIGSKSLTDGLEPMREANRGRFVGLRMRLKKESTERFAKYQLEHAA